MEVKKGYKQTDVGIIPDDWELVSYDDGFNFHSTATYSREQLSTVGDVYYVHYGDIHTKWKNFLDFAKNTLPTISEKQAKGFPQLEEGDLIIVDASEDYAGVGTSVEIKNIGTNKAISGLHTFLLKTKDEVFINGFKGYIHNNGIVKKQFDKLATGLKVYGVSRTNLKKVLIPLPPTKQEQTAIAQVLSDTDELISSLEKLIEKKKLIKQGVMQQLLTGKKRLPGFSGVWVTKPLTNFLEYEQPTNYIVNDTEYDEENGIPVLTAGKTFILGYTQEEFGIFSNLPVIIFDDFTTATKFVDFPFKVKSSAMKILKPRDENVNLRFIYEMMQRIVYPMGIGDHKRHWIANYQFLEIAVPEPKEQNAISELLSDMETEINLLEHKLNKYKSIKQGMMQNLLTGKIRLV